eukprot:3715533-Amphidinium_carterae.1
MACRNEETGIIAATEGLQKHSSRANVTSHKHATINGRYCDTQESRSVAHLRLSIICNMPVRRLAFSNLGTTFAIDFVILLLKRRISVFQHMQQQTPLYDSLTYR